MLDPLGGDEAGHGYRPIASLTQRATERLRTSRSIASSAFSRRNLSQLGPLVLAQPTVTTRARLSLAHPVRQRARVDPQLPGHLRDRLAGLPHNPNRALPELLDQTSFVPQPSPSPLRGCLHATRGNPVGLQGLMALRVRSGWLRFGAWETAWSEVVGMWWVGVVLVKLRSGLQSGRDAALMWTGVGPGFMIWNRVTAHSSRMYFPGARTVTSEVRLPDRILGCCWSMDQILSRGLLRSGLERERDLEIVAELNRSDCVVSAAKTASGERRAARRRRPGERQHHRDHQVAYFDAGMPGSSC